RLRLRPARRRLDWWISSRSLLLRLEEPTPVRSFFISRIGASTSGASTVTLATHATNGRRYGIKSLTLLRPVSHHCRQEVTDKMSSQQPPSQQPPSQQPASVPVPASASPVERTPVVTEQPRYNFRAAAVVGFIFGAVDILIAARFLGKLLGASSQSAFVHFIYQLSGVMVAPFTGIFGDTGTKTNTFESASLVAIVVYAVIGWGLVVLIMLVKASMCTEP